MATEELLNRQIAEFLKEEDAEVYQKEDSNSVALTGDAEFWRVWPELSPDKIPQAIDFLNAYTSVNNFTRDLKLRYVDDPITKGETWPGRWRQAFVRRISQGDVTQLAQALRKGYAEKIKWDEARIKETRLSRNQPTGDNPSNAGKQIEVFWPNCSPFKLEEMANSLNDDSYVDPTIAGEKRTGTWYNNLVLTSNANDGSGIVTLFLGITHFRLDGYATWLTHVTEDVAYLWGWEKNAAQAIGNAWKAKGRSCRFSYRSDSELVDIILSKRNYSPKTVADATSSWDCRYKEITTVYYGVEDETLYPIDGDEVTAIWNNSSTYVEKDIVRHNLYYWVSSQDDNTDNEPADGSTFWTKGALIPVTPPADGISYKREVRDNRDGSWDIIVRVLNVQYRDVVFQTTENSADATIARRQQLGLTTQTAEPMTSVAGVVRSQRVSVRDDCSKDVTTDKDTGLEKTSTIKVVSSASTTTVEDKTVQESEIAEPSAEIGHEKRVDNKESRYPYRYDTHEEDRESHSKNAIFRSIKTSRSHAYSREYSNYRGLIQTPTDVVYGQYAARLLFNDDGSYDGNLTYRINDAAILSFSNRSAAIEDGGEYQYSRSRAKTTVPTAVQGFQYQASNTINEDDSTYNGRLLYQYSKPKDFSFMSNASAVVDSGEYQYLRNRAKISTPVATQGFQYQASNSMNEGDGTYSGRLLYQYSKPKDFSFMSSSAAIIDSGEYQYLRNRAKISAPTAVQGYQYQASNALNEGDGTYSAKLLYQYSKPKDFSFSNRSSATEDGGEYQYNSNRAKVSVPSATQGYQYQASNTLNEGDGTYNGRLIYQYGKPVNFQFLSTSSAAGTDTQYAYRKSRSLVQSPAALQGYVYNADNTLNEGDGTYNAVVGVKIPADQYAYSKAQNAFRKSSTSVHTASKTMLAEPSEVQGYAYSRSNRVRPGGLYQTEQLDSTAVAKTVSFTASVTDKQTAYAYQYNNTDSIPNATAVQYANVGIAGKINDHLMYDYRKTIAVAKIPLSCAGDGATWVTHGRTKGEYLTTLYGSGNVVGLNYISGWRNGFDIFTHVLKFHLTAIAAAAEINGADDNSTFSSAGDNLWMSHKITHAFNQLNTYSFTRPKHSQDSIKHVYLEA